MDSRTPRRVLRLSGEPAADDLLSADPLALVVGMLLDQQVPMERAFRAPWELAGRLAPGADPPRLDPVRIAEMDPDELAAVFAQPPALHRFPSAMASRVGQLCRTVVATYGGEADAIWLSAASGEDLLRRLEQLPGFGHQKAKIFVALLGKQCGVTPPGWRQAGGEYAEDGVTRSVADITGPESLAAVRAYKQATKAAARAAKERGPS